MATATLIVFFVTEEGRANGHGNVLRGFRCREGTVLVGTNFELFEHRQDF